MAANQFVSQVTGTGAPDEIIITIGHVSPPVIIGSAEEQRQLAAAIQSLKIRPLLRVSLTRQRLGELADVIAAAAKQYDEAVGGGDK
jgi:hypothetical protein